jgi:hypothetical protein
LTFTRRFHPWLRFRIANGRNVWPLLQESLAAFAPLRGDFTEKTLGSYRKVWPSFATVVRVP